MGGASWFSSLIHLSLQIHYPRLPSLWESRKPRAGYNLPSIKANTTLLNTALRQSELDYVGLSKWNQLSVSTTDSFLVCGSTVSSSMLIILLRMWSSFWVLTLSETNTTVSGGLLVAKYLTEDGLNYTPGSQWNPKASTLAPWLTKMYQPMLPIFQDLKVVLVSIASTHDFTYSF